MVNKALSGNPAGGVTAGTVRVVGAYLLLCVAGLAALAVLSDVRPSLAGTDPWVHQVIVTVLAGLLLVRARAARSGSAGARRAVVIIATVLAVANLVELFLAQLFPLWMRVESVLAAVLMVLVVLLAVRERRAGAVVDG